MKSYYCKDNVTLYHGDCREILPWLSPVDAVICDPVWPNAVKSLAGSDDPVGLFAEAAHYFPRLAKRAVIHLGCDSDPRFLLGMPKELPFFRVCWLDYAVPSRKGRLLYGSDVAYVFGKPIASKEGARVIPGRSPSGQPDFKRPKSRKGKDFTDGSPLHPCPRRLDHVRWLVKWFADGVVLDPFCGIGTTLVAAKMTGLPAVGIEIEEKYCERAAKRLDAIPRHMFQEETIGFTQGSLTDV